MTITHIGVKPILIALLSLFLLSAIEDAIRTIDYTRVSKKKAPAIALSRAYQAHVVVDRSSSQKPLGVGFVGGTVVDNYPL
jgi:hypothetical protein